MPPVREASSLLGALDRFLTVTKAARRPSTLHLMERAHGLTLAYHADLLRHFDRGVHTLASIVRGHPGQHSVPHTQDGAGAIEAMRQGFLDAARSHYPKAFAVGHDYAARTLGGPVMTPGQVQARVNRQEQHNAHFVDRSLMDDVRARFARASALVVRHAVAKQDEGALTDEERAQRREDRRREALIALLLLLRTASDSERPGILDEIETRLGGTAAERDAEVMDLAATLPVDQEIAIREGYAAAIMEDLATTQTARVGLYAAALWALVSLGFSAEADAAGYSVDWVTTSGDPCDDCLAFESDGPYAPGGLTAVPGDGSTVCLSNCRCILQLVPAEDS